MTRCVQRRPNFPNRLRLAVFIALLATLAGCGNQTAQHARSHYNPSRYYPPPGSANDQWGPYIREASARFGVPEVWIRRVMRQESGGQEDVISWAGAMGLMQVMPDTYDELRARYGLGDDPFDPHNNILAGTAYLREMYERFGSPGFLAAYNAGPNRLDRYLNDGTPLPVETVNYVASIAPLLGSERPASGPLAVYASAPSPRIAARPTPAGCDADAAYNPDGPCTPRPSPVTPPPFAPPPVAPPVVVAANAPLHGQSACDPDAAYDPTANCRPLPVLPIAPPVTQQFAQPRVQPWAPARPTTPPAIAYARPAQGRMALPVAFAPAPPPGRWAIQVGTFASLAISEAAAERARAVLPDVLRTAKIELPPTAPFGSRVAFQARLFGLTSAAAQDACSRLSGRGVACIPVPPTRNSF